MSIEAAVVIGMTSTPLKWHAPPGRSVASIPDDAGLWDFIWKHRKDVRGLAHTHPGWGWPAPSYEDVTTFSAIERALGRRLEWWIASSDRLVLATWGGPEKYNYSVHKLADEPEWLEPLRDLSK